MNQVGPLSLILSGDADNAVAEVLVDPLGLGAPLREHGDGVGDRFPDSRSTTGIPVR